MGVNSNAIAQVTIQDQDLLTAGQPILAQRLAAQVLFPSTNAFQFSGYQVVTSNIGVNLLPGGVSVSFVYIRNATQSGSNVLVLNLTPTGSGSNITINLSPGGLFVWACPTTTTVAPVNSFTAIVYSVFAPSAVVMEYAFAY